MWGINYVAQQKGSQTMTPFAFNMFRMVLGAIFVTPIILMRNYKKTGSLSFWLSNDDKRETIRGGMVCGLVLICGITCQQIGIKLTSVGKAGFLSSLSVMVVPLIGILQGKKVHLYQWVGIFLSVIGVGLLSLNEVTGINFGDLLMLLTSFFIALHILTAGFFNKRVDSFQFTFMRFFFGGLLCLIIFILFEKITIEDIKAALPAILFSGLFGSGLAFTLMSLSQAYLDNISTSLIMSLESVFAALSGWMILGQGLSKREVLGCIIVFFAVLGMQVYGELKRRRENNIL